MTSEMSNASWRSQRVNTDPGGGAVVTALPPALSRSATPAGTMFERYTGTARMTLIQAVREAQAAGHAAVDTEHLLLGIAAGGGPPARVLAELGGSELALRMAAGRLPPGGRRHMPASPAGLTWRLRQVLALAEAQAVSLGQDRVSPEHLLLALAAEGRGRGVRAMAIAGVPASKLRAAMLSRLGASTSN
jgi:ATP-dependent Clp protease ATP-binding subunit ClpC